MEAATEGWEETAKGKENLEQVTGAMVGCEEGTEDCAAAV
tara:strand:+ start:545 stop:664 length:120 start_codon:yes stop_codon:yes gene_type:complete